MNTNFDNNIHYQLRKFTYQLLITIAEQTAVIFIDKLVMLWLPLPLLPRAVRERFSVFQIPPITTRSFPFPVTNLYTVDLFPFPYYSWKLIPIPFHSHHYHLRIKTAQAR